MLGGGLGMWIQQIQATFGQAPLSLIQGPPGTGQLFQLFAALESLLLLRVIQRLFLFVMTDTSAFLQERPRLPVTSSAGWWRSTARIRFILFRAARCCESARLLEVLVA